MFETMIITLREGMEAFLIVAVTLAYLAHTNRHHLKTPVYYGALFAVLLSACLGVALAGMDMSPAAEGGLALIAGALVIAMTVHMLRAGRQMGSAIRARVDHESAKNGRLAQIGIFAFIALMVGREGVETALMMTALADQTAPVPLAAGALCGLALAVVMGWLW